jgi:hypothetical protein
MLPLMLMLLQSEPCPWLNAATAGGFLGTTVTAVVSRDACRFTGREGAELQIAVQTIDPPRSSYKALAAACGSSSQPLKAIGNEAVVCTAEAPKSGTRVIGRVRDRIFTIEITTSDREKARAVAEQVAGILF